MGSQIYGIPVFFFPPAVRAKYIFGLTMRDGDVEVKSKV